MIKHYKAKSDHSFMYATHLFSLDTSGKFWGLEIPKWAKIKNSSLHGVETLVYLLIR